MTIVHPESDTPPTPRRGAHHCGRCPARWSGSNIAHCAECHRTFTTVANFDRHRAGSKDRAFDQGECSDPSERGLVLNDRGQWAAPGREDEN